MSIELNKFLEDLKTFKAMYGNKGYILTIDQAIQMVEYEIEEIRQDHNQGDTDDADR